MEIETTHITVLISTISIVAIDLSLAVDNAMVMGTLAAKLPAKLKKKAILFGSIAAAFFRILFAIFASRLFVLFGLTLVGGLLLLWVAWKLWRELQNPPVESEKVQDEFVKPRTLFRAVFQIILADLSMSLDNTLAVAGTARDHFWIMVFGLTLSVCLMGIAANLLTALVERFRWISYVGLAIVTYSALNMIWEGSQKILVGV